MSSSLVLELQRAATSADVGVSELLRRSLLLAAKLNVSDFGAWCEAELAGYPGTAEVPSYRRVRGELRAHNPFHGWIPVIVSNGTLHATLEVRSIRQSVGELEDLHHSAGAADIRSRPVKWCNGIAPSCC